MRDTPIMVCMNVAYMSEEDVLTGTTIEKCSSCGDEVWVHPNDGKEGNLRMKQGSLTDPAVAPEGTPRMCLECSIMSNIKEGDFKSAMALVIILEQAQNRALAKGEANG